MKRRPTDPVEVATPSPKRGAGAVMLAMDPDQRDGRDVRTPMAFLGYQQRWAADESQVKVCEKSRRIGLSWGEAGDSALLAAKTTGMDCWYIGYTKDMAEEFIRDCGDWLKFFGMAAGEIEEGEEVFIDGDEKKSILTFTIRCASGHRITALSSSPRNLRGKQGRVIIDEAAFHTHLAELLKAAMALLIWGGQVHVISTHDGDANPFNELVQDIKAGKVPYSLHTITFRDALADGLFERVCLRRGVAPTEADKQIWVDGIYAQYGSNADEELDCIPKNGSGSWLTRALIEARMKDGLPVLRWAPPAEDFVHWPEHLRTAEMREWLVANVWPLLQAMDAKAPSYVGEDFGRTGDLTVIAPCQLLQNLTRYFPFLLELRNCPFDQQREALFYIIDRLPNFRHGKFDARGNGQYLAEKAMQKYGESTIEQVMLSRPWYRDNTAPLKAAFEDGGIVLPKDRFVMDDLRCVVVDKGIPLIPDTRTEGADGGKRHGDSAVALMLAYAASRAEVPPPVGETIHAAPGAYAAQRPESRFGSHLKRPSHLGRGRLH